jgi:hypothetical protein
LTLAEIRDSQTVDLVSNIEKLSIIQQTGTPNPDVLCNREIKFDVLHEVASLGADFS